MIKRTVVVGSPAYLCIRNQQLVIDAKENGEHTVPIEDMAILIVDNVAVTYTQNLLIALNENNIVLIVCDEKHLPCSLLLALDNHSIHSRIVNLQANMPRPIAKSLWQKIIKGKINAQIRVLKSLGRNYEGLKRLSLKIKSGDPDNCEAQAARIYWLELFGKEFRRDQALNGINALLNYGYILLRSAVARAIVGTGLHPALGIFHKNKYNNFCLADDLLEPLRPLVDITVHELLQKFDEQAIENFSKEIKQELIRLLEFNCLFNEKRLPILVSIDLYTANIKQFMCEETKEIIIPEL